MPEGLQSIEVDYNDESSLVKGLRGQDALIITLAVGAPQDTENKLIEAAATAKVPWILPNVWSPANEALSRELLLGEKIEAALRHISKLDVSSYIAMCTSFWYEYSLSIPPAYGFNFDSRTVTMFDDGNTKINSSTWPQVGRAVASLLSLKVSPEGPNDKSPCIDQFKNKYLYTSSFTVSQKDMLDSVLRVTNTKPEDWTVTYEPSYERYAKALEQMKSGDRIGFVKALYTRAFYPDGHGNVENTKGLSNTILGLPKEDLDEYTKVAMKRAEDMKSA